MFSRNSDSSVIRRVLGGNVGAFRVLVERYGGLVQGVAYAHLGNHAEAEDVTQETFIRLYQLLDRIAWQRSIGPWLVRVARNVSIDLARKKGRESLNGRMAASAADEITPNPAREELHKLLMEQLNSLEPDEREVLVLYYFLRKKRREMAAALDVSTDAVEKRLQRARESLGRRLSELLGNELDEFKPEENRTNRIMAAVAAAPGSWTAGTALETGGAFAAGAGAAKIIFATAVAAILLVAGGYWGWQRWSRPYTPQDITASSQFSIEEKAAQTAQTPVASPLPAATPAAPSRPSAEPSATPTEAPSVPAAYGVVRGVVLTEDGQPVPSAPVSIDNNESMTRPLNPSKLAVDRTTITDGYGRFRFEEIPLEPTWQQDMPIYMIWTQLGDQAAQARFLGDQITRERYLELVLANVDPLAGIVTDMTGKPVEEASVSIRTAMISKNKWFSVPALRTGPDGRFVFRYLLPGQYKLSVNAKGFLQQTTFWLRTGTQDIVVRLDRGLAISGRVTDAATGKPFTGCYVGALPRRGTGSNAEIDSSGQFTVAGLLPEVYSLRLTTEHDSTGFGGSGERCPYCLANPVVVDLTKGKPVTGLELKAITGGAISGQVLDAATGDPVAEAGVQALDTGNRPVGGTQCDWSGIFRLEGLAAGKYTLKSEHKDYEKTLAPAEVEAGQVLEGVVIRLSHPPGITGRVIDADGNPVAGAAVSAVSTEDAYWQASGVSDKSGAFGLYFKPDPPQYTQAPRQVYVQALHESGMSPRVGPVDVRDPGEEIILEIASTGRIEGEVVDQNGAPVSRADVAAVPEEKTAANIMTDYREYGQCSDHIQDEAQTRTSFSGSFSLDSLLPGTYELQVYLAASPMTLPLAKTTVFVRAGQVVHARLVVDTSPFGTIEGRVTMNGKPFPGQLVWAFMKSVTWRGGMARGHTDEEGRYRMDCMLPGEVTVALLWQPLMEGTSGRVIREQSVEVTAGQVSTVDFDVPVASTYVEGVVTTNGLPEDGALLQFTQGEPSAEQANVTTDSQGFYRIALPEGAYGVNVHRFRTPTNLMAMQYATVQALADQTVRLDISFVGGVIEGALAGLEPGEKGYIALFPGDTNVPQWTLQAIESLGNRILRQLDLPSNGPFLMEDVEPGFYVLGAAAIPIDASLDASTFLNAGLAVAPVEVQAGEKTTVELVIK